MPFTPAPFSLEPVGFVDDVGQWLAVKEVGEVFQQHGEMALGDLRGLAGDVRGEDDVGHFPQRMIGRKGFDFEHVQGERRRSRRLPTRPPGRPV